MCGVPVEIRKITTMKELLIIEDDQDLSRGLCLALNTPEIACTACSDLKTARERLSKAEYDLILLDINLPDGNGLELLKEIKKTGGTPVVLLTANDTEMDMVAGLEQGADDYITKPFSLAVLRARIHTQLRRREEMLSEKRGKNLKYCAGPFQFDFDCMTFYCNGKLVELSKTEQKLLRFLVENAGITLSRSDLVDRIWTDGAEYVDENALSVTVKRLRDKLEAAEFIKTVYGIGYTWVKKYD